MTGIDACFEFGMAHPCITAGIGFFGLACTTICVHEVSKAIGAVGEGLSAQASNVVNKAVDNGYGVTVAPGNVSVGPKYRDE